jgi:3-oxoacyl-[acyl-carrier-protein] synthase-3
MSYIHGIGHFHPETEITNEFLEDLDIGTTEEWILERTGIRSRRTVLELDYIRETRNRDLLATAEATRFTNAELGQRAARMAFERAGVDASDIGLVIAGGSMPTTASPAEACTIAADLDLEAPGIDIRSACTSFGAALHMISMLDPAKAPEYILVVVPESCTRSVDYGDRRTAVLWGDGAAAAVVSVTVPASAAILSTNLASQPSGHEKIVIPWAGHFEQDGSSVQRFAIRRTAATLRELQQSYGSEANGNLRFIGHQANLLMLENVCRTCEIPEDRHLSNVADFGNTGSAGAPGVLSQHWDGFRQGDYLALVGVGSGLTWSGSMLRFGGPSR